MTTMEIANQLVALCRQGKFEDARALYADDAVSVEAGAPPGGQREAVGLAAQRKASTNLVFMRAPAGHFAGVRARECAVADGPAPAVAATDAARAGLQPPIE